MTKSINIRSSKILIKTMLNYFKFLCECNKIEEDFSNNKIEICISLMINLKIKRIKMKDIVWTGFKNLEYLKIDVCNY